MTNYFELAKANLTMRDVLESYGVSVNRVGMCLCPFHNEKTPSCKVYLDSLHCFGCGEHHDIISFVKLYNHLNSQIDALKKLNDDFNLGFNLDKPSKFSKLKCQRKPLTDKELFKDWEQYAWKTLRDKFKLLGEFKEKYAPKSPFENLDERYVVACHNIDYAEYILLEFMNTDFDDRKKFQDEVTDARAFIEKWTSYCPELSRYNRKREPTNRDKLLKRRCC